MMLPCRDCGSLTPTEHGILHGNPILCDHCKQAAPSRAPMAVASPTRKRKKRAGLASAETYLTPESGDE